MSIEPDTPILVLVKQKVEDALLNHDVTTADFVDICHAIISVFDNLGTIFSFAKSEFTKKNASLHEVCDRFTTLREVVNHDKTCGLVCKKGSCARNLHRLGSALTFILTLMQELTTSLTIPLKDAANTAYQRALAPIHTAMVKSVITAGLLALPTRSTFLESINESEETAKERTAALKPLVEKLVAYIDSLYDEPMPVSNTWFIST